MADSTVEDYLKSWGLQAYVEKFREHALDFSSFLLLSAEDIKELIPVIGHRALFNAQIKTLRDVSNNETTVITVPADHSQVAPSGSSHEYESNLSMLINDLPLIVQEPNNNFQESQQDQEDNCNELRKLLQSANEGQAILLQFESVGLLDNNARRRLCNIIINKELQGNPEKTISSKRLYDLAFQITKVFVKESAAVYFTPYLCFGPNQKSAAKGKLLDTYRQKRKEFTKFGLIPKKRKSTSTPPSSPASPAATSSRIVETFEKLTDDEPDETTIEQYLLWLKNSCDPWMTVLEYWNLTRKSRFKKYANTAMSIADYFNNYRALGQSGGLYLLLEDYSVIHPDSINRLFENWPLHRANILELAKKKACDPMLVKILSTYKDTSDEDVLNTVAFMSLPYLMSTSTIRKPKTQKQWRPSKIESQQGFIMHVVTAADLESSITLRKEKIGNLGFTVQPFIVIIGPSLNEIHTRYIVVNNVKYSPTTDIRYNSTSIINAVDGCFKILFALNAEYPAESAHVWTFIQKAMYKVNTKYDKVYTTVNAFMTDLGIIC